MLRGGVILGMVLSWFLGRLGVLSWFLGRRWLVLGGFLGRRWLVLGGVFGSEVPIHLKEFRLDVLDLGIDGNARKGLDFFLHLLNYLFFLFVLRDHGEEAATSR